MTTEENKALVRRHLVEVYEQGRVELIDDYYTPDGSVAVNSAKNWRQTVLDGHKYLPGFKVTILDMVAEGDKVAVYWQVDGTFVAAPNEELRLPFEYARIIGKPVAARHLDILRFEGGKLVAWHHHDGGADTLVKLGVYTLASTPSGPTH